MLITTIGLAIFTAIFLYLLVNKKEELREVQEERSSFKEKGYNNTKYFIPLLQQTIKEAGGTVLHIGDFQNAQLEHEISDCPEGTGGYRSFDETLSIINTFADHMEMANTRDIFSVYLLGLHTSFNGCVYVKTKSLSDMVKVHRALIKLNHQDIMDSSTVVNWKKD